MSVLVGYIGCYDPSTDITCSKTNTDKLSECAGICAGYEYFLVHKWEWVTDAYYRCSCLNEITSTLLVDNTNCMVTWCDSSSASCGGMTYSQLSSTNDCDKYTYTVGSTTDYYDRYYAIYCMLFCMMKGSFKFTKLNHS